MFTKSIVAATLFCAACFAADAEGATPAKSAKYFHADIEKWAKVVNAARVSAD